MPPPASCWTTTSRRRPRPVSWTTAAATSTWPAGPRNWPPRRMTPTWPSSSHRRPRHCPRTSRRSSQN
jgi:isocitrate dehydrogenase